MQIRFPATDAPHYMAEIAFSRSGDAINIEIVDERGRPKALYSIPRQQFTEAMAMFGCIKEIATDQVIRIKDF